MWDTITGWVVVIFVVVFDWATSQPALFWLVAFFSWVGLKHMYEGLHAIGEQLRKTEELLRRMDYRLEMINLKSDAPTEEV